MPQKFIDFSSWDIEGIFIDRWSFVHFAWGAMLAALLRLLGFSRRVSFGIALTLMLGWEIAEWSLGMTRVVGNSLFDVLLASAGFWLAHKMWPSKKFSLDASVTFVILGLTVFVEFLAGKI